MNLATGESPYPISLSPREDASSIKLVLHFIGDGSARFDCLRLTRKDCVPPRDPLAIGVPAERMAYGILGESGCPYCSYADCETDPECSPPHRIGSGVPGGAPFRHRSLPA